MGRSIWRSRVLHTTQSGISGRTSSLSASSLSDLCSSRMLCSVVWRNINKDCMLQKYTLNYHNQHFYLWRFGLYQRPSSEEVWSILLPVLATVVMGCGKKSDKSTRWIKEAVHIRKEGRQSLNRDEGSHTLSHTYDRFLATSHHYCGKNRKKNWSYFFWWRSLIETETSNVKMLVVVVNSIFL